MKKTFERASMEELKIMQTAGGPINNYKVDNKYYAHYDDDGNVLYWSQDYGKEKGSNQSLAGNEERWFLLQMKVYGRDHFFV